jgi:hypothetical protein
VPEERDISGEMMTAKELYVLLRFLSNFHFLRGKKSGEEKKRNFFDNKKVIFHFPK